MRRLGLIAGLAMSLAVPGMTLGATADGVLITGTASATYTTKLSGGLPMTISYGATVTVMVATPVVAFAKVANPSMQASGGVVTFCISYSNRGGLASAFDVTITDVMPDNMRFVAGGNSDGGTSDGAGTVYGAWATAVAGPWTAGTWPNNGQAGPVILRWQIDVLSPRATGFVCYAAQVM